jgi:hypothetical protein
MSKFNYIPPATPVFQASASFLYISTHSKCKISPFAISKPSLLVNFSINFIVNFTMLSTILLTRLSESVVY